MPQLILTAPLVSNVIEVGSNGFQSLGVPLFSWLADGVQLKMFPPRLASQLTMNKLLSSTLIKVKCLGSPLFLFFFFFFFFCDIKGSHLLERGCLSWFDSANNNIISRSSHWNMFSKKYVQEIFRKMSVNEFVFCK